MPLPRAGQAPSARLGRSPPNPAGNLLAGRLGRAGPRAGACLTETPRPYSGGICTGSSHQGIRADPPGRQDWGAADAGRLGQVVWPRGFNRPAPHLQADRDWVSGPGPKAGVGEALLANTSAGDQELVEALLGLKLRYGAHTFDLPALTCWLRAALEGWTQPPALVRVEGLPRVEPARVEQIICRAARLRPDIYRELAGVPEQVESLLSEFVGRLDEELLELIFGGGPGGRLARYFEEGG